jgi:hypothetical protein
MRARGATLLACVLVLAWPARAMAQEEPQTPTAGPTPLEMMGEPLPPGDVHEGTLTATDPQDTLRVDVDATVSLVQFTVRAGAGCEVWAHLLDFDGVELGAAAMPKGTTGTVTALLAAAGPIFLQVDGGPFAPCDSGNYRAAVSIEPIDLPALSGALARRGARRDTASSPFLCMCWSDRVEALSVKVRRTRRLLAHATGRHAVQLRHKLHHLRSEYRHAKRMANTYCATSGLRSRGL